MDNQCHQENNTDTFKSINNINNICNICNIDKEQEEFVSMVHKWRLYGGYSKYLYPRYFCSTKCIEIFERDLRCNYCNIIIYNGEQYKKGADGMTYCNDEFEITIGDTPCYNLCFPPTDIKSSL
jgi:hypothetical protein